MITYTIFILIMTLNHKREIMDSIYSRTELLIGGDIEKLKSAKVLLLGVGGVGGYALEMLARVGVGNIDILDADVFSISNLNRQILATVDTIGKRKVDVAKDRVLSINPDCKVQTFDMFYLPENADKLSLDGYDYVIDCIDTVSAKLDVIVRATSLNIPIISCMGTGNKLQTNFEIADVYNTSVCPLAKVMRKELKARGVKSLKVVYSKEEPIKIVADESDGRHAPASICYAPAIAGTLLASEVIKDIIAK